MRGLLIGLVALLAQAPARAQTHWEIAMEYPANAMPGEGIALFAKLVTERSGGRLTVTPSFDAAKRASEYEALPSDLQRIVDDAAAETERRQWAAICTRLDESYARMRANGVTIAEPGPADLTGALATAAKGATAELRRQAGQEGEAILAAFRTAP
jgi:TRAP-type C4-dicarboxylate transport system substrate-binding protein